VLYERGDIDASDVEVEVKSGEVTLSGTVDTRRTKHLIEEVVEDQIHGIRDVNNQVRVKRFEDANRSPSGTYEEQQRESGKSERGARR
jgi:hypothetical protein